MFIKTGNVSLNMQSVIAVAYDTDGSVEVYLTGSPEPFHLNRENAAQFEQAFQQLLSLEQAIQQTNALLAQKEQELRQREAQIEQTANYVNTMKAEIDRQAATIHLKKNQGLIRPR